MQLNETAVQEILDLIGRGVARSTQRLADLSGARWNMHIVSVDVGGGERFRSILARDGQDYLGASFSTPGERYLVIFSNECGRKLARAYAQDHLKGQVAEGLEEACVAEIANILIGGLAGEVAERQGMGRILSAPTMTVGKKAAILARAFGDLHSCDGDVMVDALIHISSPELAADCTLLLRLDSTVAAFLLSPEPVPRKTTA